MAGLPARNPDPFDLGSGTLTVAILHGYTGTPYEVRPLGEALARAGYRVVAPLLPGHGADPRQLADLDADQLLAGTRELILRGPQPQVLVGFSLGALLAGLLATEISSIRALVLMAPAVQLRRLARAATAATQLGLWRVVPLLPRLGSQDCADPAGALRNPSYERVPLRPLLALDQLAHRLLEVAPTLRLPTQIFHGRLDHTVPVASSRLLARHLGGQVDMHVLWHSRHLLALDRDRALLFSRVQSFLGQHAPPS